MFRRWYPACAAVLLAAALASPTFSAVARTSTSNTAADKSDSTKTTLFSMADGDADEDSAAVGDPANDTTVGASQDDGDNKVRDRNGSKAPWPTKARAGKVQGRALWYAMTWQSNELPSKDDAIYHCVRAGRIVGRAHIVKRGEAARFSCRYNRQTDWPYGVKVYQPAGRRVVVKVGTKKVQDYGRPEVGRDVWVVEGNPTGWWRTYIT
jgi:hypothetical protein